MDHMHSSYSLPLVALSYIVAVLASHVTLGLAQRLRPQGGQLRVVVTQPGLRRIFEVTLLDRVFTLFPTRADALDRL